MNVLNMSRKPVRVHPVATMLAVLLVLSSAVLGAQEADRLDPAPEGSFSVVVIPDTQGYRGQGTKSQPDSKDEVTNPVFDAHTRWIVDNIDAQRIVFVSHSGDIVDRNVPEQWDVARACMDRLHGRVPYAIAVGNHDMKARGDSSLFQQYFPASRFEGFEWYGGCFEGNTDNPGFSGNNANSFQLISAEGLDLLFLHLECNAPDSVLQWADSVMDKYPDRWVIVTTHMGLGPLERPKTNKGYIDDPKGRMRWKKVHGNRGNTPQQMWEKCFRKHANLLLVCSGDQSRTVSMCLESTGDHGNTIYELTSDYTSSGPLRIYRFTPAENTIRVITYDTRRGKLVDTTRTVPEKDSHQFVIERNLTLPALRKAEPEQGD